MQQIDAKAHNRHSSRYLHRQFGMPSFSFTLSFLVCMFGSWSNIGVDATAVTNLRPPQPEDPPRDLSSSSSSSYHTLGSTKLGVPNPDAAIGNPLKGLVESPVYTNPPYKADIPLAVEFYYFGQFFLVCNLDK